MKFKTFAVYAAVAGIGTAASAVSPEVVEPVDLVKGPSVLLIWEKRVSANTSSTSVWNIDQTDLHGYSCSDRLAIPNLGLDLEVKAGNDGYGEVLNHDQIFTIDFDPSVSGGISCTREYSHDHAISQCVIPVQSASLMQSNKSPLPGNSTVECFDSDLDPDDVFSVSAVSDSGAAAQFFDIGDEDIQELNEAQSLQERQAFNTITKAEPNKEPRKWRRHQTLTSTLNCNGSPSCSTGAGKAYTVTHSASFGLSGVGSANWISAGYSVSVGKTTSETYTCGGKPNDKVCVKNWRRYQAYKVRLYDRVGYEGTWRETKRDPAFYIRSPLKEDRHQEYYCGINSCKGKGYVHWEDRGSGVHGGA